MKKWMYIKTYYYKYLFDILSTWKSLTLDSTTKIKFRFKEMVDWKFLGYEFYYLDFIKIFILECVRFLDYKSSYDL